MATTNRIGSWLREHRGSTRLGFVLQISCRVLTSLAALAWTPLLLGAMGARLNGLYLNLQSMAALGGLGDLGVGGLVNLQTSQMLGQGKEAELRKFLAAARGFFVVLGALVFVGAMLVAPRLLAAAKFPAVDGVGSLPLLALVLAAAMCLVVVGGYAANLNYGCGNTLWPPLPTFLVLQIALLGVFLAARAHLPLWGIYLPFVAAALGLLGFNYFFVRRSHPALAAWWPLTFDWPTLRGLLGKNFWLYLFGVSNVIYVLTDVSLVTRKFGAASVPLYVNNGKLCELAIFVVNAACLVSLPKITQWLASAEPANQLRARVETERLSRFQVWLGCAAVLVYLPLNEWFVRAWLGVEYCAPLSLQIAYACLMVATASGQAGLDLASRCCERGIRVGGTTVFAGVLLNFVLSWLAMRQGWMWGIALASAVAHSCVVLRLGKFSSAQLGLSWWRLTVRGWLLGLAVVSLGVWTHEWLQIVSAPRVATVLGVDVVALVLVAYVTDIRLVDLRHELNSFKTIFGR